MFVKKINMEYAISDYVIVHTNKVKQIEFVEEICGVNIYYMVDKTSYSETQILRCAQNDEITSSFINDIKNNGDIYMKEFYDKKEFLVNSIIKWVNENVK